MGTGYKNRGSGAAGLGFKNRGAKLVDGAAYTNRGATDGVNEAFKNRGQSWGSDAYYNRGPNDFASLSVLGLAEFYAPLTHSLVLTRGTGSATFTRATKAWEFGYSAAANSGDSQVLMEIASGTPRFGGARYDAGTWYDTYADGSAIPASTLLGYHAEGARTNSLLGSRDLRNAASSEYWRGAASGSELAVNGDFSDAAGWSLSSGEVTISGGKLNFATTANRTAYRYNAITQGKTYHCTFTIDSISAGSVRVYAGRNGKIYSAAGTYECTIYAADVGAHIGVSCLGATTAVVDNLSVKEASIQVTTCTGIDNAANSASTLTAGAADATILQTLTLAAAARSFSAYVKRRTGSGNIYITRDGGTNWTDVTSQINSSTWTRVKIEDTSVLNPQVGFKIATSGDAIDVDCVQDEAGAYISSPIITTTAAVTRNSDILYYAAASNIDFTVGSLFTQYRSDISSAYATNYNGFVVAADTTQIVLRRNDTDLRVYDGTNTNNLTVPSQYQRTAKLASSWSAATSKMYLAVDAALAAGTSFDGSLVAGTNIYLCNSSSGASPTQSYIKELYIWSTALTAAQLQQVTS